MVSIRAFQHLDRHAEEAGYLPEIATGLAQVAAV
jgi:hypothetical protein